MSQPFLKRGFCDVGQVESQHFRIFESIIFLKPINEVFFHKKDFNIREFVTFDQFLFYKLGEYG